MNNKLNLLFAFLQILVIGIAIGIWLPSSWRKYIDVQPVLMFVAILILIRLLLTDGRNKLYTSDEVDEIKKEAQKQPTP